MKEMFTKEQLEIALLNQKNDSINQSLTRLENHMNKIESRMDSHFHWMLGSIFGSYTLTLSGLIAALCKTYGLI